MVIKVVLLQLQCALESSGDFSKMQILILKIWLGPEILQTEFTNNAQVMAMQLVLTHENGGSGRLNELGNFLSL